MIPEYALTLLRLILAMLFLFCGVVKLSDLRGFSGIIAKFGLLQKQFVRPFAYSLPFIQIFLGAWLLTNRYLFEAAVLAVLMMLVSEVGIGWALYKKKKIDNCGCYGTFIQVPVTKAKFAENLVWLAIAIILVVYAP